MNQLFRPVFFLREQETLPQSQSGASRHDWPVATAPDKPQPQRRQSLSRKLGVDVFAAMCTAFSISPFILTIDKAVCDAAVQRFTMRESVTAGVKLLFTKPHLYFSQKAYAFVFAIYTITYATANFANTWATDIKGTDPSMPKFLATTAVNVPLSVRRVGGWVGPIFLPFNKKDFPSAPIALRFIIVRLALHDDAIFY